VTKSSARTAAQLLKLRPYKTVIHALHPRDQASRVHFCNWFLQSVVEGEIDPQLTFCSEEAWFHLQGYKNTQNNHYWSSQIPHLTHEVLLHPLKVGVWRAVSARRIAGPVFFNETINCGRYVQGLLGKIFPELTKRRTLWRVSARLSYCSHCTCLCRLCPMSSGTDLSAAIFGQHVHPILVLAIFFSGVYNCNHRTEEELK
jgi:hypothetical protein